MTDFLFRIRGGTAEALATVNPLPYRREPYAEIDTGRMKIGDGVLHWNDLPYVDGETPPPPLPDQTGNEGRVLGTDGTEPSWVEFPPDELPLQTGNTGLFLSTDGTIPSWAEIPPGVMYQPEPPEDPAIGQLWVDSDGTVQEFAFPLAPADGGVPSGGAAKQHLVKITGDDYDSTWADDLASTHAPTAVVSADYAVGADDVVVIATPNCGTVTLPDASADLGRTVIVKTTTASVIVTGTEDIDTETSVTLDPWEALTLIATGTQWVIV